MSLIEQAKKDVENITSDKEGFAREIRFISPGGVEIIASGLHTKTHLALDPEGTPVNSRDAHISVSEIFLTQQNYPVRNADGEVDLKNHRVKVKDSTGVEKTYLIREWFPDETVGLITCILGDFE